MTISSFARRLGGPLPSADEKAAANQLRKLIAAHAANNTKLMVLEEGEKKPTEIILTPALSELMTELLRYIGDGDAVTLVPVSKLLTTQQAADILNVSRPFLISLLDRGDIAHSLVGRHRRIRAEDLFSYKRARDEQRSNALAELAAMDADVL